METSLVHESGRMIDSGRSLLNQLTDYLRQKIQISDWQFEK